MAIARDHKGYEWAAGLASMFYNANKSSNAKRLTPLDFSPWTTADERHDERVGQSDTTWAGMGKLWKNQLGQTDPQP